MTRQGMTSVNCGSFILENPEEKKKDKLFICRLHQIYVIKAFKGTNYQELSLCKPWHFIRRVQKKYILKFHVSSVWRFLTTRNKTKSISIKSLMHYFKTLGWGGEKYYAVHGNATFKKIIITIKTYSVY